MVKKKLLIVKPELDQFLTREKKTYVTYQKGAEQYGVERWTFTKWAKAAGATLKWKDRILVDLEILDEYLQKEKVKPPKRRNRNAKGKKSD